MSTPNTPLSPQQQPKRFGLVVIGDEILSRKRIDQHLVKVIELLAARGLSLSWASYLGDDRRDITETFKRTFASGEVVFSTGGIGATPDDHTRQAAAAALGVDLVLHPEAERLIAARIQATSAQTLSAAETGQRMRMGEFPAGADIIPNPYNQIPGFMVREHYFVPGFPIMAWPMIEWVLDTRYSHCFHRAPQAERAIFVFETAESALTPLMEKIEAVFPAIKVFSLPSVGDDARGGGGEAKAKPARRHIELGVKGPADSVETAYSMLKAGVAALGAPFAEAP
jgi:molybdopterin-biosynthesis enzyme MoeA-like protein